MYLVLTFELACYSAFRELVIPQLDFRHANLQELDTRLQDVSWAIMQELEIEEGYQFLKDSVSTTVDACVPQAKPSLKKVLVHWPGVGYRRHTQMNADFENG